MESLPTENLLSLLMSSEVDAVSFYRYEAHLIFENGNRVSFSCSFRFEHKSVISTGKIYEFPIMESQLTRILGSSIETIRVETDKTLVAFFTNGDELILYANDSHYESYSMLIDGKEHYF